MVGIFFAGAVVGGVSSVAWVKHKASKANAQQVAERQMRRLVSRLDLSEEQIERIRPLIQKFEREIREARRAAIVGTREILREMNERVQAELTAAQRKVFAEMCDREQKRFEHLMKKRREHRNGEHEREEKRPDSAAPPPPPPPELPEPAGPSTKPEN